MHKDTQKAEAAKIKRQRLIEYSVKAREIRDVAVKEAKSIEQAEFFASQTLNYFIVNSIYKSENKSLEFKSFNEWKDQGATIKKGEKAYAVWGQPLKCSKKAAGEQTEEQTKEQGDEYEFFPIRYLFSNDQVFCKEQEAPNEEKETPIERPKMDLNTILA